MRALWQWFLRVPVWGWWRRRTLRRIAVLRLRNDDLAAMHDRELSLIATYKHMPTFWDDWLVVQRMHVTPHLALLFARRWPNDPGVAVLLANVFHALGGVPREIDRLLMLQAICENVQSMPAIPPEVVTDGA